MPPSLGHGHRASKTCSRRFDDPRELAEQSLVVLRGTPEQSSPGDRRSGVLSGSRSLANIGDVILVGLDGLLEPPERPLVSGSQVVREGPLPLVSVEGRHQADHQHRHGGGGQRAVLAQPSARSASRGGRGGRKPARRPASARRRRPGRGPTGSGPRAAVPAP